MHVYINRAKIQIKNDIRKRTRIIIQKKVFLGVKNKNISFTRENLIQNIWGYDYVGESRMIDDLVKRLRKKLKSMDTKVEITTVWGYGYRIDDNL